jgi:hypothetical protein
MQRSRALRLAHQQMVYPMGARLINFGTNNQICSREYILH